MASQDERPSAAAEGPSAGEPGPAEPGPAEAGAGKGAGAVLADTVRKAVLTGLGAVFLTEENARRFAREWKLPKEIAGYAATQVVGARDEVVRVVSEEVRKFFESPVLRRELLRMLGAMSIEVRAEISLKPVKGQRGHVPVVKVTGVKPKVRRGRAAPEPEAEPEPAEPAAAPDDLDGGEP